MQWENKMPYTDITKMIPTMQSVSLVSHNIPKKGKKKKLVKTAVENIVGLSLIQTTSKFT